MKVTSLISVSSMFAMITFTVTVGYVYAQVGYPCDIDADCLDDTFCDRRNTHKCLEVKPVFYVVDDDKKKGN
ncbi:hypothetical protein [Parasitella parasitica]|uniref:Uncharacterized protein n=1 Tax=Parasitella parasitica TaxID=35722 RepID=A0A0B7NE17_9FUNG|nr:hypothetical protein [Parasitella parasitica]